ncbi:MAG: phosphatidylglycerol lysyltransferase domain-containing protein [Gemmatimonadales bacterium]
MHRTARWISSSPSRCCGGRAEGYHHFNLGMAPLAGLPEHALAPLWSRVGNAVFEHGERFYGFQGLRQYKAKFDPAWVPRYLASPVGGASPARSPTSPR